MSHEFETATVGEIVANDFRAAGVFTAFGIDFCCGGRRSLADACRASGADPEAVGRALATLPRTKPGEDEVSTWALDRLIDHILTEHHAYVRSALPTISAHLAKLVNVHGGRHPELARVAAYFDQVFADLEQHMAKEEQVLFPYIRELARGDVDRRFGSPFGTIENPIHMMEREHQEAGDAMRVVRELTNMYTPPADGCTTYRVCLAELDRFERDLHRHVHLENNLLFPKAAALERDVLG